MPPVALPTSRLDPLLLLALPGILLAGWIVARMVVRRRLLAMLLAPGIALAAWNESAHLAAFAARSFSVGVWLSSLTLATVGYVGFVRHDMRPKWATFRQLFCATGPWLWLTALLATALLAPVALRAAFHDEIGSVGHLANISTIQNGHYPPRDLVFPQLQLKYHYGYDLLCAMLSTIWRTNASVTSDIVTLGCWAYAWVLAWTLGQRKGGRFAGPLTALILLYGAGAPLYCPDLNKASALGAQLLGFCSVGGVLTNPPFVSYHFQHPWTIGLPLALTAIYVFDAAPRSRWRAALLALLLAALAICQFVLFVSLAAAIPVAEAVRRRRDRSNIAWVLGASVVALLVASRSGGFFAPSGGSGMGLELHFGIAEPAQKSVEWLARVFGLLIPLGLIGLAVTKKPRLLLLLLAAGGLAVINLVRYKLSWDIVKFATVASIALSVPTAALLARGLRARSLALKGLSFIGVGAIVASGIAFQAALLLRLDGVPAMYQRTPPDVPADDAAAAAWLRTNLPRRTVMYRRHDRFRPYAVWAGLPQVWMESRFVGMLTHAQARGWLLKALPAEPKPWLDQNVRFFVIDSSDGRVLTNAEQWLRAGHAIERARFGEVRVIELR